MKHKVIKGKSSTNKWDEVVLTQKEWEGSKGLHGEALDAYMAKVTSKPHPWMEPWVKYKSVAFTSDSHMGQCVDHIVPKKKPVGEMGAMGVAMERALGKVRAVLSHLHPGESNGDFMEAWSWFTDTFPHIEWASHQEFYNFIVPLMKGDVKSAMEMLEKIGVILPSSLEIPEGGNMHLLGKEMDAAMYAGLYVENPCAEVFIKPPMPVETVKISFTYTAPVLPEPRSKFGKMIREKLDKLKKGS